MSNLRAMANAIRPLLHSKSIKQRIDEIKIIAQENDITFEEARGVYNDRKADFARVRRAMGQAELEENKG